MKNETVGDIFSIFEDFTYDGVTLNIIKILDDIWFRAKDITAVLGYTDNNTTKPIRKFVDDEDKKELVELWESKLDSHDFDRQNQDHTLYLNESGMYALIFASKLPAAKAFKRWVTSEVIPIIRKTGQYQNKDLIDRVQKLELENQNKDDIITSTRTQIQNKDDIISSARTQIKDKDSVIQQKTEIIKATKTVVRTLKKDVEKLTTFKTRYHNRMKTAKGIKMNGWIYIVANPSDFKNEIFKVGMTTKTDANKRLRQYGTGYSKSSNARRIMEWPVFGPRTMESKIADHLQPYKLYDKKELYQIPLGTLIKTIDYYITHENKVIKFTNKVRKTLNNASDDERIAKGNPAMYERLFNTIHDEYFNAGKPGTINDFYDYLSAHGINISGFKWLVKIIVKSL